MRAGSGGTTSTPASPTSRRKVFRTGWARGCSGRITSPGLPEHAEHFDPDHLGRRLRGRRRDDDDPGRHAEQTARTNALLSQYLTDHEGVIGPHVVTAPLAESWPDDAARLVVPRRR